MALIPLLVLLGCSGAVRDKGLSPARSTLEALQQARAPRRIALVVGVDRTNDPSFPPLRHAGDDAERPGVLSEAHRLAIAGDFPKAKGRQRLRIERGGGCDVACECDVECACEVTSGSDCLLARSSRNLFQATSTSAVHSTRPKYAGTTA